MPEITRLIKENRYAGGAAPVEEADLVALGRLRCSSSPKVWRPDGRSFKSDPGGRRDLRVRLQWPPPATMCSVAISRGDARLCEAPRWGNTGSGP